MYNDVNVRLLKAFAGRWVDRAETDTRRSMRRLAEYGISFSSGSLKEFFSLSREILNDSHSPYYLLAYEFIRATEKGRITQFGINFGYNGFAHEKKKETPLAVTIDGADIRDAASFHQQLTQWDAHEASIVFLFCDGDRPSPELIDAETKRWPKRAFFLFTDDPAAFTSGMDLFFGGGDYDHNKAFQEGLTVAPWPETAPPPGLFTAEDGTELIPA